MKGEIVIIFFYIAIKIYVFATNHCGDKCPIKAELFNNK